MSQRLISMPALNFAVLNMGSNIRRLNAVLAAFLIIMEMTLGENCPDDCTTCTSINNCSTCVSGKYGASCENDCSKYCKHSGETQVCQKSNGACMDGCDVGYWGDSCTIECAKGCLGNICNQTTGDCIHGCKANFYGHRCTEEDTSSTSTDQENSNQSCDQNNKAMVALYVVTSISVLVAAVSVTGIVILLNRRRFCHNRGSDIISPTHFQEQELESQDYQNSDRTEDAGGTYDTVNHVDGDYENDE